jgi:hypothetical protein
LTLPNIEPFWLCFNIRSTAYNVNNLYYIVLIFFLDIPIPCYIFIKQISLFVLGGREGFTYNSMFYMIGHRINNSLNSFYAYICFFLFCRQCCHTFSWSLVDVLTREVLIGNRNKKILLTLSLFVSAIKYLTWSNNDFVNIKR